MTKLTSSHMQFNGDIDAAVNHLSGVGTMFSIGAPTRTLDIGLHWSIITTLDWVNVDDFEEWTVHRLYLLHPVNGRETHTKWLVPQGMREHLRTHLREQIARILLGVTEDAQ